MNVERPDDAALDDCEHVLERVYEFLDNEIDAASGDAIRHHPPCANRVSIGSMSRKPSSRWSIGCCGGEVAPSHLRAKIVTQLTVIRKTL